MHSNIGNRSSRPPKKQIKQEKLVQKQEICGSSSFSRKEAQQELRNLEEDKSDYQDPILKRANKWWQRIDKEYFKTVTLDEVINKREICTSNQVLTFGEGELPGLPHFREEISSSLSQGFLDRTKIRVLFKTTSPYQTILGVFGVEAAITSYHSDPAQSLEFNNIRITSTNKQGTRSGPDLDPKQIRLDLQDYEDSSDICDRFQKLQEVQKSSLYLNEIDKQIAIWENELQKVNHENHINWNKLIRNVQEKQSICRISDGNEFESRIREYKDKLYWGTVLRSFMHGFKDKTKKMLETYIENERLHNAKPLKGLQKQIHGKQFFETDCKICFSSDNSDSNQVLYCDSCNTSFHLVCYGLTSVPQEEIYFCERCTYIKKEQDQNSGVKFRKPYCQICLKTSFPMKKLDDHFYHVTCLVLFNFVEFRGNRMVLRGSLTHQNILRMVVENEIKHDECNECGKAGGGTELGMQIQCSYQGCSNYCHPICAYLNGYRFEMRTTPQRTLEIKMFCNDHLGSRVEQVYLRRYMCNLNETSSKSFGEIRAIFENDQQVLQRFKQSMQKNRKKYPNRILAMTRFIKNLLKSRSDRGGEDIETETQAILNRLKDKKAH